MCGIAAIFGKPNSDILNGDVIQKMISAQKHRGPDGVRTLKSPELGVNMAHARLSIIDLEKGWQPLVDHATMTRMVFNGEIYNYKELQKELKNLGHHFSTDSDSEVILKGYHQWGYDVVSKLSGMFAFTIFDAKENKLFFARDHIGIKPLYYSHKKGHLFLSSELRPLIKHALGSFSFNPEGMTEYLSIGYSLAPNTIAKDIFQVLPGEYGVFKDGELTLNRYYSHVDFAKSLKTQILNSNTLNNNLEKAIASQLVADVEVGTFLSGGIDSTLVSHFAIQNSKRPIKSFTADFKVKEYSEYDVAINTAKAINSPNTKIDIKVEDLKNNILQACSATDAPIFDNSFVAVSELCKQTQKHVKVALSGDGGDELFLGYETYKAFRVYSILKKFGLLADILLKCVANLVPVKHGKVNFSYKIKAFSRNFSRKPGEAHCGWREIIDEKNLKKIVQFSNFNLENSLPKLKFQNMYDQLSNVDSLTRLSIIDLETWVPNNILVKTDRASMRWGLEVRVPLLDKDLVQYAIQLSSEVKYPKIKNLKNLLKQAVSIVVPSYPLETKKKGFNVPMSEWLNSDLSKELDKLAKNENLYVLNTNQLNRIIEEHKNLKQDHGYFLWALVVLNNWLNSLELNEKTSLQQKIQTEHSIPNNDLMRTQSSSK